MNGRTRGGRVGRRAGLLTYLFCTAALTGCDRPPKLADVSTVLPAGSLVGLIGPPQTDARWRGVCGGARRYGAQYPNVDCLALAPTDDRPTTLSAAVNDVLAKHPVAVCLYVDQPDVARPAAERITDYGALLVTINARIPGTTTYGHVEVGLPEAAGILGQSLPALLPAAIDQFGRERTERSYVLLHEDGKSSIASDCYVRFKAAAPGKPAFTLLRELNAAQSDRAPHELIQDMLDSFRTAELVVTLDPRPWLSLQPRFKLPHRNHFATLGASPALWPRLRSGEAAALVGPLDGEIGYAAVQLAVQGVMALGDTITRRVIRCELITPQTLDDFARRYAAAADLDVADLLPRGTATQPASAPDGG